MPGTLRKATELTQIKHLGSAFAKEKISQGPHYEQITTPNSSTAACDGFAVTQILEVAAGTQKMLPVLLSSEKRSQSMTTFVKRR